MKKGIIRKYDANPDSEYLEDKGVIPDPDFWSNEQDSGDTVPIWAVCGTNRRPSLEEGEVIFFTPMKETYDEFNELNEYICTGVMVVDEFIESYQTLSEDERIDDKYKMGYFVDLIDHILHEDIVKEGSRERDELMEKIEAEQKVRSRLDKRVQKIALGDPERSVWFGRNKVPFKQILEQCGLADIADELSDRRKTINNHDAVSKLYDSTKSELDPIEGQPENLRNNDSCRVC
jgi:hypothetical protein